MTNVTCWYLAPSLALAIVTTGAPASAATITVNTTAQASANATDCTLTQAIIAANTDTAVNGCPAGSGPDTIELPMNQQLILTVAYDVDVADGLPPVTSPVTIKGNGVTIQRVSDEAFRILDVVSGGALHLDRLTITNGFASEGGGIRCIESTLSLYKATVTGNQARSQGRPLGGGIAAILCSVTVTDSTISDNTNTAVLSGNVEVANGGGLGLSFSATILSNTTVSGNTATSLDSCIGGGLAVNGGTLTLTDSTVSNNVCSGVQSAGGGGLFAGGGEVILTHSIVSGNSSAAGPEIFSGEAGSVDGDDFNVIGVNGDSGSVNFTPSGTDIVPAAGVGIGAVLTPLASNGGPTKTHALPLNSPALDVVPVADCPGTDQRGVMRPQGLKCDVGSFERETIFPFTGFLRPVDNPDTFNFVKAGAGVPVKFQLGGNQGLNIFATGSPASQQLECETNAVLDPLNETVSAGGSSLSYDATTETYTYVWKTQKAWANSCRELHLTLIDGTVHSALFRFWK